MSDNNPFGQNPYRRQNQEGQPGQYGQNPNGQGQYGQPGQYGQRPGQYPQPGQYGQNPNGQGQYGQPGQYGQNPNGQGQYGQPYGQQPGQYGQPYGQPGQYGRNPYGQGQYGQNPYGPQPGYGYGYGNRYDNGYYEPKSATVMLVFTYITAVLGGLLSVVLGLIVYFRKDTLPDGTQVPRYKQSHRTAGLIGAILGALVFIIALMSN